MNDRDERRTGGTGTEQLEETGPDNPGSDEVDVGRDDRGEVRLDERDDDPAAGGSDRGGRAGGPKGSR